MNKMTPLREHTEMELLLRPRRPTEDGFLDKYDQYVGICFSASWCVPCQKLDKVTLIEKTPSIKWYSVDVDENQISLGYCSLRKIPSFCIIKDGLFTSKLEGPPSVDVIIEWLKSNSFPVLK